MTSNHLKKVSVFILIIGFLCTCLFGCTDKPASGNDVNSTTESTTKGEESTTIDTDGGNEEDSSVHKEKSPVKKDDETTTNKKTNVKESSTKKVDKETTTKGTTTTEPTTEAYTPAPLVPLTAEQELKIKEDYLEYKKEDAKKLRDSENQYYNSLSLEEQDKYRLENGSPDEHIDELIDTYLKIRVYFGTYNNCVVMILDSPFSVYFQAQTFNEIGGYVFAYPVMRSTAVYRNGEFVTLEQAYEKGWLSDENMKDIYYYHCKLYCDYEYKDGDFIIDDFEAF